VAHRNSWVILFLVQAYYGTISIIGFALIDHYFDEFYLVFNVAALHETSLVMVDKRGHNSREVV
jgi:hypothetical protein